MFQIETILTGDGSYSLHVKELNENYHSLYGAVNESLHVFINAGLKTFSSEITHLKILEIGLGTGLNAFLTFLQNRCGHRFIEYTAIEAYPLDKDILKKLNYIDILGVPDQQAVFTKIHETCWEQAYEIGVNFKFLKMQQTLQEVRLNSSYDLIYFDAFGPRAQPEMWTEKIFTKLFSVLNRAGMLVTYCAKGEVKRILKKSGFIVQTLPGPPGKREMIRAVK